MNSVPTGACFASVRKVAVLAFLLGATVLTGWMLNITLLKSAFPGLTATQPMTALCIVLCALALFFSTRENASARILTQTSAGLVLLITALILLQNALDTDWGTDRLLFPNAVANEQTGPYLRAGRPAGASLIAFALLGISILLVSTRSRLGQAIYVMFASLGAIGAASLLLAYAFGLKALYVMGLYVQVGLYAAIGLGVLFAGLMVRRADLGWMRYICGSSMGAVSTRWLLSWTIAVLVVLVGIVQFGTRASWYRAELEIALVTLAGIGVLFAGLLSHARRIDALERTRRGIAEKLHGTEERELQISQALADSREQKKEFLEKLAHELRNPLAPLRNGLHILQRQTANDQKLKPTVEMMERQVKSLSQAIDILLDEYSRDPRRN